MDADGQDMNGARSAKVASIRRRPTAWRRFTSTSSRRWSTSSRPTLSDHVLRCSARSSSIWFPPANLGPASCGANQVIEGNRVTVEISTIFQQLVSVLSQIRPAKLNQTLGAPSPRASTAAGNKFGQSLEDLDAALTTLNPSLDTLNHEIAVAPAVLRRLFERCAGPGRDGGQRDEDQRHHRGPERQFGPPCWSAPSGWPTSGPRCSPPAGSR